MSLVRAGLRLMGSRSDIGKSMVPLHRCYASCKKPKGVVVGVYSKDGDKPPKTTANAVTLDDALGGKLLTLIRERGMDGSVGKGLLFSGFEGEFQAVAVVGVGNQGASYNENEELDEGMENVRVAAGTGARALQLQGMYEVHVDAMEYPEQAAEGAVGGSLLCSYNITVDAHR